MISTKLQILGHVTSRLSQPPNLKREEILPETWSITFKLFLLLLRPVCPFRDSQLTFLAPDTTIPVYIDIPGDMAPPRRKEGAVVVAVTLLP